MNAAATMLDSPYSFPLDDLLRFAAELVDRQTPDSLAVAEALLNEARPEVEKMVAAVIEKYHTSPDEPIEEHPFREYFSILARLAEKQGDPERALNALRMGREYMSTDGNPNTRFFRDDIDRLRRIRLGVTPPTDRPTDFDPDWLVAPERTEAEIEDTVYLWAKTCSPVPPRNATEARHTPLAQSLIRCFDVARIWPEGQQLWRLAALNDRFGTLGLTRPTRQLRIWERAFEPEGAIRVAFGLTDPPESGGWDVYQEWLSRLEVSPADEETVLATLPHEAFGRIAARLEQFGPTLDIERSFFEAVLAATVSASQARQWLQIARTIRDGGGAKLTRKLTQSLLSASQGPAAPEIGAAWWRLVEGALLSKDLLGEWALSWLGPRFLWPLAFVWNPSLELQVAHAVNGALDRRPSTRMERLSRARTASWLAGQVGSAVDAAAEEQPRDGETSFARSGVDDIRTTPEQKATGGSWPRLVRLD